LPLHRLRSQRTGKEDGDAGGHSVTSKSATRLHVSPRETIRLPAGLHNTLVNARTTIKAQIAVNTVSNFQNSELKSMPLSCSGRSNGGGQGGIFRPSSFGSMIHLRCLGSHAELGAISIQAAAVLPLDPLGCDQTVAAATWQLACRREKPPLSDRSGGR
jgi:hypothetical protein